MSKERYGIRRFALLNTAGYSLGLFPLEDHCRSTAKQPGKSASINALQFDPRAHVGHEFRQVQPGTIPAFHFASTPATSWK
jgi:hypothetical protein